MTMKMVHTQHWVGKYETNNFEKRSATEPPAEITTVNNPPKVLVRVRVQVPVLTDTAIVLVVTVALAFDAVVVDGEVLVVAVTVTAVPV